jgi:hypothetical protein
MNERSRKMDKSLLVFAALFASGSISVVRADMATLDEMTAKEEVVAENLGANPVPLDSVAVIRVREPKKTLGKGLSDRDTGERVQLACIGDRLTSHGLERKCELLRFIYANEGGEEYLVGPAFALHDDDSMKYQMKKAFAYWNVSKKVEQKKSFMVTRLIYGGIFNRDYVEPVASGDTRRVLQFGLYGAQFYGISLLADLSAPTGVAIAGYIAGSLLAPVILDLAILPITAIIDAKNGKKIWGFSGKDLKQLQSRSNPAWSLKPKKTRSKRFQVLLRSLLRVNHVAGASTAVFPHIRFSKNGDSGYYYYDQEKPALSSIAKKSTRELLERARLETTDLLNEIEE